MEEKVKIVSVLHDTGVGVHVTRVKFEEPVILRNGDLLEIVETSQGQEVYVIRKEP
jgi:hypothetical protein